MHMPVATSAHGVRESKDIFCPLGTVHYLSVWGGGGLESRGGVQVKFNIVNRGVDWNFDPFVGGGGGQILNLLFHMDMHEYFKKWY